MESKNKVNDLLRANICAQGYFSSPDKRIEDDVIFNYLIQSIISFLAVREIAPNTTGIILTGKFAKLFLEREEHKDLFDLVSIVLGVEDNELLDLSTNAFLSSNSTPKNWLFVDDAFYAGETRDKIKSELHDIGLKLIHTLVIFDGSLFEDKDVSSIYNYYEG